jgi:hypothetical protein
MHPHDSSMCASSWRYRFLRATLLLAATVSLFWPSGAVAQGGKSKKGNEAEKVNGTVTEIEKKGKATTLSIDKEGGGNLEVLVTPRLKFSVTGNGDTGLIQPKSVLSSEKIVKTNNELFGHQFTLHVGNPPPFSVKREPGGGDWYHVCGQVVAMDDKSVTLNFGASGGTQKLTFEEGTEPEVTVISNDPDLVVEGSKVELEGMTRGSKFIPSKVTVTLEKPLTIDDLQAASNDKKASKTKGAATAKGGKKPAKAKTDEPEGIPTEDTADPFGVLGKKEGKEAGSKGGDRNPPEKKGTDK